MDQDPSQSQIGPSPEFVKEIADKYFHGDFEHARQLLSPGSAWPAIMPDGMAVWVGTFWPDYDPKIPEPWVPPIDTNS